MELNPQSLEKNNLFEDVYDMKVPKRIPSLLNLDNAFCLEYAGMDLKTEQFSIERNIEAMDKASADFDSDTVAGLMFRMPSLYKLLGAKNFVMGGDGFLQHPNVKGLEAEDYDAFIADPFKTLWDKVFPRLYNEIAKGGIDAYKAVSKSFSTFYSSMGTLGAGYVAIANKYGKTTYSLAAGSATVPFDYLADQLRSFTGIMGDIRRYPEKVVAACEALTPLAVKAGLVPGSSKYLRTFIPLHMGPYMKPKDFEKFYWPTFDSFVKGLVEAGAGTNIFVEEDYTRYLDYLYELPQGQMLLFEYGDAKEIKDKLGKKHIISGLYPVSTLRSATEKECIDKAKEMIDILAPGGNFIFSFDKSIIRLNDVNVDNLKAVLKYVKENGTY